MAINNLVQITRLEGEAEHGQMLEKIWTETDDLLTNAVEAVHRDHNLRVEAINKENQEILKQLEQEQQLAKQSLIQIGAKWEVIDSFKVPQDIHQLLESQKLAFEGVLRDRNETIRGLKVKQRQMNEKYQKIVDSHLESVNIVVKTMNDQAQTLCGIYQKKLLDTEQLLCNKRAAMFKKHLGEFDLIVQNSTEAQEKFLDSHQENLLAYQQKVDSLARDEPKDFSAEILKLDEQMQVIEEQLNSTKTVDMLKEDQLKYNYETLKKQHEESAKIRSNQKRKLFPLRDQCNSLRNSLTRQSEQINAEKEQIFHSCTKYEKNSNDLRHYLRIMKKRNSKTFLDMWDMNTDAAQALLKDIFDLEEEMCCRIFNQEYSLPASGQEKFIHSPSPDSAYDQTKGTEYWKSYLAIVSEDKISLWNAVLENLKTYHVKLLRRAELKTEVEALLQENEELRLHFQAWQNH